MNMRTSLSLLDKLEDEFNTVVAKILTLIGIDNYIEDKHERVQSAEVDSNKEYIIDNYKTMYESRVKAFNDFNKKFGTNIKVIPTKNINDNEEDQFNE